MSAIETPPEPALKVFVGVWLGLLAIVGVEVALTYARLPPGTLLAALLGLAVLEAGLGLMYFMHLKYERGILFWSLIPTIIFVLVLLNHLWRDAARLLSLHL